LKKSERTEDSDGKRVIIYARVSTDDPRQSGSCENQIARCQDYCRALEYEVVATIKDEGVSAKTMNRPGWVQVEKLLMSDAADLVLTTSLDRMTRTIEGFLRCVKDVFEPSGKRFITIQEHIDTSHAMGRMAFHMLLVLSQFMREQTAEKVSGTRLIMAKQGLHPTISPFGTMPGTVKGIPEKDPDRWTWVETIFKLAAEGMADSQILDELAANRVVTRRGAAVGKTTLPYIIANRFYLGEVNFQNEWYPAKHDCRIDKKLWKRAQRKRRKKRGPVPQDYVYLLDGLLVSSHFQVVKPVARKGQVCPFYTRYTRNRHGTTYFNYVRGDCLQKHGGLQVKPIDEIANTLPKYINAKELDEKIVKWLTLFLWMDRRSSPHSRVTLRSRCCRAIAYSSCRRSIPARFGSRNTTAGLVAKMNRKPKDANRLSIGKIAGSNRRREGGRLCPPFLYTSNSWQIG